jgi:hypothetical protein
VPTRFLCLVPLLISLVPSRAMLVEPWSAPEPNFPFGLCYAQYNMILRERQRGFAFYHSGDGGNQRCRELVSSNGAGGYTPRPSVGDFSQTVAVCYCCLPRLSINGIRIPKANLFTYTKKMSPLTVEREIYRARTPTDQPTPLSLPASSELDERLHR